MMDARSRHRRSASRHTIKQDDRQKRFYAGGPRADTGSLIASTGREVERGTRTPATRWNTSPVSQGIACCLANARNLQMLQSTAAEYPRTEPVGEAGRGQV
jgi:hypothetical protein